MPAGRPIFQPVRDEILARMARGERVTDICREPGMPRVDSVGALAKRDPFFAARYQDAKARGDYARKARVDPVRAAEVMRRLAEGERMHAVLGRGGMPSKRTWKLWLQNAPDLAEAHFIAKRDARFARGAIRSRKAHRDFDPAIADRIVARCYAGATLRRLREAVPEAPSMPVLTRWRREQPEFNRALKIVLRLAHAHRQRTRLCNDAMIEAITDRVLAGETLRAIARDPAMPCGTTLNTWSHTRPDFYVALEAALRLRADMLADDAVDEAEAGRPGAAKAFRRLRQKVERLDAKAGRVGPRGRG